MCSTYEGCSVISALCLITFIVNTLWQCGVRVYEMNGGWLSSRLIPNVLLCYARLHGHHAVSYSALVSRNWFLNSKLSNMHFWPYVLVKMQYKCSHKSDLLLFCKWLHFKQKFSECRFAHFKDGTLGLLYEVIDLQLHVKYKQCKNNTFEHFHNWLCKCLRLSKVWQLQPKILTAIYRWNGLLDVKASSRWNANWN